MVEAALPVAGTTLRAGRDIETLSGSQIPAGANVEVLGLVSVAPDVAASGYLLNFRYRSSVYVADLGQFLSESSDPVYYLSGAYSRDTGSGAEVCATLLSSKGSTGLDLSQIDLEAYVDVYVAGDLVSAARVVVQEPLRYRNDSWGTFCAQALPYATEARVVLKPGLISGEGLVAVERALEISQRTANKAASLSLNQGAYILPLETQALLPVTLVNVPEFSVSLTRIDPRTVSNLGAVFLPQSSYDLESLARNSGQDLGTFTFTAPATVNEEIAFNLDLDALLDDQEPGLFVAVFYSPALELSDYEDRPTQWFVRSDLAVTSYAGLNTTQMFIHDFATAEPVPNAQVQIVANNNRELFLGQSNAQGWVQVPAARLAGSEGNAPAYAFVTTQGGDFSLLDLDTFRTAPRHLAGGQIKTEAQDAYLTLARDLVRPGESVDFYAALRDLDLAALPEFDLDLVLINAWGEEAQRQGLSTNQHGAVSGQFMLSQNAPVGRYVVEVRRKDEVLLARTSFSVDAFVPLTIEAKVTTDTALWDQSQPLITNVSAGYFSGGPAAGLSGQLEAQVRLTRIMAGQSDFVFGPLDQPTSQFVVPYQSFKLGEDGTATVRLTDEDFGGPALGLQELYLSAAVFDVGGRPNKSEATVPLDTATAYVGIRPEFEGRLRTCSSPAFTLILTDREGVGLADQALGVTLSRQTYRYDWYYDQGWRWRRYLHSEEPIYVSEAFPGPLTIPTGLGWGTYRLSVETLDGFVSDYDFNVGWGGSDVLAAEPSALQLSYVPGEEAQTGELRFEAPFGGQLQVHVAHSDLLSLTTFEVEAGSVSVPLTLPEGIEPGVNVLATLIRPIERGSEHLPQIALGRTWVEMLSSDRMLAAAVALPEVTRSIDPIEVSLDLPSAASVQLFLVDEGIHAISGFQNVDPVDHFFGERALSLGFASNFGRLIQQDDSLEAFEVGGDDAFEAALAARDISPDSDFFDTVVAISPLIEFEAGTRSYVFEPAGFEGRLRLVALVADADGTVMRTQTVRVQDPVSLDISLPRFVALGDQITTQIQVRANEDRQVQLNTLIDGQAQTTDLSLLSGDSHLQALRLSQVRGGQIPLNLTLTSGDLAIEREFSLGVRPSSYPLYETQTFLIEGRRRLSVPPLTFAQLDPNQPGLSIRASLSPFAGAGFAQVIEALRAYPYGCVEQTSSGTRALVFQAQASGELDPDRVALINEGIERLMSMQRSDGSFGYWSRNSRVYDRFQPYAVETLILALPYSENPDTLVEAIDRGLSALQRLRANDPLVNIRAQGVLAAAGREASSQARYLLDTQVLDQAVQDDLWIGRRIDRLGLGLWLADAIGDDRRARQILQQLSAEIRTWEENNETASRPLRGRDGWQPVGSWTVTGPRAWESAHLLTQISPEYRNEDVQGLITSTAADISSQPYRSTHTNARLAQIYVEQISGLEDLRLVVDGQEQTVSPAGTIELSPQQIALGFRLRVPSRQAYYLNIEALGRRNTQEPVDAGFRVTKTMFDRQGQLLYRDDDICLAESPEACRDTARLCRDSLTEEGQWRRLNGALHGNVLEAFRQGLSCVNASDGGSVLPMQVLDATSDIQVAQGALVTVVVEVTRTGRNTSGELMMTDLLPSGFELADAAAPSVPVLISNGQVQSRALGSDRSPLNLQQLDDRLAAHFNGSWSQGSRAQVVYVMRAAYAGTMVIPDAHAELMYQPSEFGRSGLGSGHIAPR